MIIEHQESMGLYNHTKPLRLVHTRRQVATCCNNTSQRQIASCVLEKLGENLCLCNGILSLWQVAQILSDLIFLQQVAATKFCCRDRDFHKIFQYTWSNLSLRRVAATCCCNLSPSVYQPLKIAKQGLSLQTTVSHAPKPALGPVVLRPISANPGSNFNPSFFFFYSKVFSQIISKHQIVDKKNKTDFSS